MRSRLSFAFYVIRTVTPLMAEKILSTSYFSYVLSIITYGIIFCGGNSPHNNNIYKIQKPIIRIITMSRFIDSCRQLYQQLENLPLYSLFIFSLLLFVLKIGDLYTAYQEIHCIKTSYNTKLNLPIAKLTAFQRGALFFWNKVT